MLLQFALPKSKHVDFTTVGGRELFPDTANRSWAKRVACVPVHCALCQFRRCPWQEGLVEGTRQVSKTGLPLPPLRGYTFPPGASSTKSTVFCSAGISRVPSLPGCWGEQGCRHSGGAHAKSTHEKATQNLPELGNVVPTVCLLFQSRARGRSSGLRKLVPEQSRKSNQSKGGGE